MRCGDCNLRHTERSGRQQDETKFCHDELGPLAKNTSAKSFVGRTNRQVDERISIGPQCGGLQSHSRIYFTHDCSLSAHCSYRVQTVSLVAPRLHHRRWLLPWHFIRIWHRNIGRHIAGQFIGPRGFAGIVHRRRHFGPRIARRTFLRRLGGLAWRQRGILNRVIAKSGAGHQIATLRLVPMSGREPVIAAVAILT